MEANDNITSHARRQRESRARLTLEQQQQYRERDAELHRTARAGFSVEQLQQHRERNTDQMRAARSRFSEEQQQQHRQQDADQHRIARDKLSEEQQHQHHQQNAEQHRIARDKLTSEQLGEIKLQDAAQHKAAWDALTQEQRKHKLQQQMIRRRRNSRNALRSQDSLVNDHGEYLSLYMMTRPSAAQLANHEQCPVRAQLLFYENASSPLQQSMENMIELSTVKGRYDFELRRRDTQMINKITGLWYESHTIKSERLAKSLLPITKHVYGEKASPTLRVEEVLAKILKRYVKILTHGNSCNIFETDGTNDNVYEFLGYDNDEDNCVISGPIHPHHQSCLVCRGDGSLDPILHVSKTVVVPEVGCPVICCGLQIATYLNGELGEVISYQHNNTGLRLEVCFENNDFISKMVKLENIQIATELPGEGGVTD
jgi:hypothetical protein